MTARGRRFLARLGDHARSLGRGLDRRRAASRRRDCRHWPICCAGRLLCCGTGRERGRYVNICLQSTNGYPALLDAEKQIHLRANAACTGATTSDVAEEQLSALKQSTRLVTLTVGAADLGLSASARSLYGRNPATVPSCHTVGGSPLAS